MKGGDISGDLPPRWLFVWEGVVASLPPGQVARFKLAHRLGRYRRAVQCWETEPHVAKVLNDLFWRRDYRFDVVTFLGPEYEEHIQRRLDRDQLPFSNVWAMDEESLTRRLVYMPDVQYVVHGDPARHLTYGHRGLLVTDPGALSL